jgi:hypothetical protein
MYICTKILVLLSRLRGLYLVILTTSKLKQKFNQKEPHTCRILFSAAILNYEIGNMVFFLLWFQLSIYAWNQRGQQNGTLGFYFKCKLRLFLWHLKISIKFKEKRNTNELEMQKSLTLRKCVLVFVRIQVQYQ